MAATRHLAGEDQAKIVEAITRWPVWKDFGWEEIRKEIMRLMRFENVSKVWSRQQLCKYADIKSAYDVKKKQIRLSKGTVARTGILAPVEQKLTEKIQALEAEKEVIKAENDLLHERFERWLYNAHVKGLSEAILDRDLPVPAKERV